MDERVKLFQLDVGVTETGVYAITYLTKDGQAFAAVSVDFKKLLDDVVASVTQTITDSAKEAGELEGRPTSYGPGAESLAKALGEQGLEVEVVEKPALNFTNDDLPIH